MSNKLNIVKYFSASFILGVLLVLGTNSALASNFRSPEVKFFNTNDYSVEKSFMVFPESFTGGVSVASCDLDNNGYDEIIVGAGSNGGPQVRTLNSQGENKFTPGFFAYDLDFRNGVNVACGDLDGDGYAEIITAPQGGAPHIRTFDRYGEPVFTPGFFAFDIQMDGGVNIAIGDMNGDGINEIITAPAFDGEPRINIYDRFGNLQDIDVYPFHPKFRGGVSLAVANIEGEQDALIAGVQTGDVSWVKVFLAGTYQPTIADFSAFDKGFKGGVNISSGDLDNDGIDEIVVAANVGGGPHVRVFDINGSPRVESFFAFENEFRGGVLVSVGDVNSDGRDEIVVAPGKKEVIDERVTKILVDLSEQRLFAYNGTDLIKTFLVSTGLAGTPTHLGNFHISQKIYSKNYSGPGYYLPNTLWNMRFDGQRLLHGAYWHNNFGHPMSHGCINISYENAEWLYNNTPMYTDVEVKN